MAINRPNDRFSNRAFRLQASTPPSIQHLSFGSADSCSESTVEPSNLEQAMMPKQTMMKDAVPPYTPSPLPADTDATVTGTDIVYLADLQPQPVEWLWQHRLAAGTLAMLSGVPGSGKTWVALAIAAALTRGRDPFTGEKLKLATVLYASAKHAAAQVIQPRFAGLHGDPARLVVLRGAVSVHSMSSPDSALRALEDALQKTQAHLVIPGLSNLTSEDLFAARPTGAGLPKRKFAAQWLRDCLQLGSQTQGSIEVAAQRDGVCIATLRRAKFDIGVRSSKDENQVPGGGLCCLRRMSTLRSTRQDAQMNCLSILSIFIKQTTYLATLPNKVRKLGKSHRIVAMATYEAARLGAMWGRDTNSLLCTNLSSRLRAREDRQDSGTSSLR